jgi:hypothetical protein
MRDWNEKGHPPKQRRCPEMSGTTERSSNLLRERIWEPMLIFRCFRPAEQGRRGGRWSGGLPPRLMLRFCSTFI